MDDILIILLKKTRNLPLQITANVQDHVARFHITVVKV